MSLQVIPVRTTAPNPRRQRIQEARQRSAIWLALGDESADRGRHATAQYCFTKSAEWLRIANELHSGNQPLPRIP